jgi:hypothetical protein
MWGHITYNEMVEFFGQDAALRLLQCIERLAEIKNDIIRFDRNARWQVALESLNETNVAM